MILTFQEGLPIVSQNQVIVFFLCPTTPVESKFALLEPRNNVGVPVTIIGIVMSVVMCATLLSQLSVHKYFPYSSPVWHTDNPFWQDPSDPAN